MSNGWKQCIGAAALCLAASGAQAAIWSDNGHEYQVVISEGTTWTAANAAAQALGAGWNLATITSSAEDAFVLSILPTSLAARSHFWLGASDAAEEGAFTWVTGEPFSYTNWSSGEPNNSGEEDYLAYDYRGNWAWNDAPDNLGAVYGFARGYVVEGPAAAAVPAPGTLPLIAASLGLLALGVRRRSFNAAR